MHRANRRPVARSARLDDHEIPGLWTTALWVLAAGVLLATFGIH